MTYAFEPGERATVEVSCERIPAGLQIAIRNKGLPFDTDLDAREVISPQSHAFLREPLIKN
jgi:hypothetical protein